MAGRRTPGHWSRTYRTEHVWRVLDIGTRTDHNWDSMASSLSEMMDPKNALIFRITHIKNVSWILQNGLHCQSSTKSDPNFRTIGDLDLIERRRNWSVHQDPEGTLSDYVSFYFTPYSIMLYRATTGTESLSSSEIAIIVTSLHKISEAGITFLFTDRHANSRDVSYYSSLDRLDRISWDLLQNRDFQRRRGISGQETALSSRSAHSSHIAGRVAHGHRLL